MSNRNNDVYSVLVTKGNSAILAKDKAVEVEVHLDPGKTRNITGWEVKHIHKTNKLFGLI